MLHVRTLFWFTFEIPTSMESLGQYLVSFAGGWGWCGNIKNSVWACHRWQGNEVIHELGPPGSSSLPAGWLLTQLISSVFVCNCQGKNGLLTLHCGMARPVCGLPKPNSRICNSAVEGTAQNQSADHGSAKTACEVSFWSVVVGKR
jgi:hypothetical protein